MTASFDRTRRQRRFLYFPLTASTLVVFFLGEGPQAGAAQSANSIERGKYLVESVAMCSECHTPRDENGHPIRSGYLRGAPVPVKAPNYRGLKWALRAPAIAGMPGYTREEGVRLLTEGITPGGRTPDPPMPLYRLSHSDAEAVVAYLKSLH